MLIILCAGWLAWQAVKPGGTGCAPHATQSPSRAGEHGVEAVCSRGVVWAMIAWWET